MDKERRVLYSSTVKMITAVLWFFYVISTFLKLSGSTYGKIKGFCINCALGIFTLLSNPTNSILPFYTLFCKDIQKNNLITEFLQH